MLEAAARRDGSSRVAAIAGGRAEAASWRRSRRWSSEWLRREHAMKMRARKPQGACGVRLCTAFHRKKLFEYSQFLLQCALAPSRLARVRKFLAGQSIKVLRGFGKSHRTNILKSPPALTKETDHQKPGKIHNNYIYSVVVYNSRDKLPRTTTDCHTFLLHTYLLVRSSHGMR